MKQRSRFKTLRAFVDAQPRAKTQAVLAREMGLTPNMLSQYLGWHRSPSKDVALRLSREFSIDLEGLLSPPQQRRAS